MARALARELPAHGCDVTVVSGSLPGLGDAEHFYAGCDVHAVRFDRGDAPMHPSYEDRPDAPDPVFAAVDDEAYEAHVAAWSRALEEAGAADADVLHLHHLTPIHEAAARVAPGVPVVGHLHGTELLMLERIADGPPEGWHHAEDWARRMQRWAERCERLLLLSRSQLERAERLLGIDPGCCVIAPNGFDPERFAPRTVDRAAFWRQTLVDDPHGWRPGQDEGSVAYRPEQAAALAARARPAVGQPLHRGQAPGAADPRLRPCAHGAGGDRPLGIAGPRGRLSGGVGGRASLRRHRGNRRARRLPRRLARARRPALRSSRPPTPSCSPRCASSSARRWSRAWRAGCPPSPWTASGPADIVRPGQTGWLVEPDDEAALAGALAQAIDHPEERRRRGIAARQDVTARYAWPALAERLCRLFDDVAATPEQDAAVAAAR